MRRIRNRFDDHQGDQAAQEHGDLAQGHGRADGRRREHEQGGRDHQDRCVRDKHAHEERYAGSRPRHRPARACWVLGHLGRIEKGGGTGAPPPMIPAPPSPPADQPASPRAIARHAVWRGKDRMVDRSEMLPSRGKGTMGVRPHLEQVNHAGEPGGGDGRRPERQVHHGASSSLRSADAELSWGSIVTMSAASGRKDGVRP